MHERFDPDSKDFLESTITHHVERYKFASLIKANSYLDLCCGTGYGTNILKQKYPNSVVVGIDIDVLTIRNAQMKYSDITFYTSDVMQFVPDTNFDVITCFEAIEHLPFYKGKEFLKRIKYFLTPNGTFILSTPRDPKCHINKFHKSIWSYECLQNELGNIFSSVLILGQEWADGSISDKQISTAGFYLAVCKL